MAQRHLPGVCPGKRAVPRHKAQIQGTLSDYVARGAFSSASEEEGLAWMMRFQDRRWPGL